MKATGLKSLSTKTRIGSEISLDTVTLPPQEALAIVTHICSIVKGYARFTRHPVDCVDRQE